MPITLGIDIGTTTIKCLALDATSGASLAIKTLANDAEVTSESERTLGRSEWDALRIVDRARQCVLAVVERLHRRRDEIAGIGITGQQHGVVVVDDSNQPLTRFIGWQDRRGEDIFAKTGRSYVEQAVSMAGADAAQRAGCRLAAGWMGTTLFWMQRNGMLPTSGTACFIPDLFASTLTMRTPVTDPTLAASSGVFDVVLRQWDATTIGLLGLPLSLMPAVCEAGREVGPVCESAASCTGLPPGIPVFVPIGDNQASFLGCVSDRENSMLVNVGTGAQVAAFVDHYVYSAPLETRPFPMYGYLLVHAGLCGGRSYAVLERFFRAVAEQVLQVAADEPLYEIMNRLAASVPSGADGLRCQPLFTGTREKPQLRASWSGVSPENFSPAHMARALLEGIANELAASRDLVRQAAQQEYSQLIGAGSGLRENPLLAAIVAKTFATPLMFSGHREEAATGAALIAMVGAGLFPDLAAASSLLRLNAAEQMDV
jgi:sugar (pentulose or hexulose) kinase